MTADLKSYLSITVGYWAFTVTDGALRMLVVLYFHLLGYSPFEVAMLFVFYELFGVITNLLGGWVGAHIGLNKTMYLGMILQVTALIALAVPDEWLSIFYVMLIQALSGVAKDLNKMSAKSSIKIFVSDDAESKLFKWVAILTGSKNSLKGIGFFIGAVLLDLIGYRQTLILLAGLLLLALVMVIFQLPKDIGKMKIKPKFSQLMSKDSAINWLSASRFFLFGARDIWFVVALPVFFLEILHWSFTDVGTFFAIWIIGYGVIQASTPALIKNTPDGHIARVWVITLALIPAVIALSMLTVWPLNIVIIIGLAFFGIVFAINSAVHSYLILRYSDHEKVAIDVGFYYMANAGGRLLGTIFSGLTYQLYGLAGCLWMSSLFLVLAFVLSLKLPVNKKLAGQSS